MDKYLSIITNFGCHYTCPYCVVRENNLHIPATTLNGLDNLSDELNKNKCNWLSLSGGGDPLHNYDQHREWYQKLISILNNHKDIKLELHTSYLESSEFPYYIMDRIVYHAKPNPEDVYKIKRHGKQIVRVVFVVTEEYSEELISLIAESCHNNPNIDELSFRQMVDSNYQVTHYCEDFLKNGHKKDWWYIQQGDYNLYYAENKVSTKYEDFKTV